MPAAASGHRESTESWVVGLTRGRPGRAGLKGPNVVKGILSPGHSLAY